MLALVIFNRIFFFDFTPFSHRFSHGFSGFPKIFPWVFWLFWGFLMNFPRFGTPGPELPRCSRRQRAFAGCGAGGAGRGAEAVSTAEGRAEAGGRCWESMGRWMIYGDLWWFMVIYGDSWWFMEDDAWNELNMVIGHFMDIFMGK